MKYLKKSLLIIFCLCSFSKLSATNIVDTCFDNTLTEEQNYSLQNLISSIKEVQSPVVTDEYIIFTADKNARFTGIVFDFENYSKIHTLTTENS